MSFTLNEVFKGMRSLSEIFHSRSQSWPTSTARKGGYWASVRIEPLFTYENPLWLKEGACLVNGVRVHIYGGNAIQWKALGLEARELSSKCSFISSKLCNLE